MSGCRNGRWGLRGRRGSFDCHLPIALCTNDDPRPVLRNWQLALTEWTGDVNHVAKPPVLFQTEFRPALAVPQHEDRLGGNWKTAQILSISYSQLIYTVFHFTIGVVKIRLLELCPGPATPVAGSQGKIAEIRGIFGIIPGNTRSLGRESSLDRGAVFQARVALQIMRRGAAVARIALTCRR